MKFFIDNIWNVLLVALALVSGGALLWPSLQRRGQKVTSLQATRLINQGKTVIVDVRDPVDFNAGHLREARNIPFKELPNRLPELEKFKSKNLLLVCQSGMQSAKATARLKKAGFNEVVSLNGGLSAWQAQGLPVAK